MFVQEQPSDDTQWCQKLPRAIGKNGKLTEATSLTHNPNDNMQGDRKRQRRNPRVRRYCFTINSTQTQGFAPLQAFDGWDLSHLTQVITKGLEDHKIQYTILAQETGGQGRQHIQGYVEFCNARVLSGVKTFFVCNWMHVEVARGTAEQNICYCKKLDCGDVPANDPQRVHEYGTPSPGQGARSDFKAQLSGIMSGTQTVIQFAREYPSVFCRYRRGIEALRQFAIRDSIPQTRTVTVEVHWGLTGSGKSWYCTHYSPPEDTYRLFSKGKSGLWFDHYEGQKTLIIDEYQPGDMTMAQLLSILDVYKQQYPVKTSSCWGAWSRVFITSNWEPDAWFPMAPNNAALLRRINLIKHYEHAYVPIFYGPIKQIN